MGNLMEKVNTQAKLNSEAEAVDDYLSEAEKAHLATAFIELYSAPAETTPSPAPAQRSSKVIQPKPNRDKFIDLLSAGYHPFLAEVMFDFVNTKLICSYADFEKLVISCTRISASRSLEMMWEMARFAATSHPHLAAFSQLHRYCYLLLMFCLGGQPLTEAAAVEESQHIVDFFSSCYLKSHGQQDSQEIDLDTVQNMTNSYLPHSAKAFQSFFCIVLLKSFESPSFNPYRPVEVMGDSEVVSPTDMALLGLHNEEMQGAWKRLYSSATDGLSFNRLQYHITGYDGPLCILIKCNNAEKTRIGAFTSARWKETNRFYGSSKTILFSLAPKLRIYRSKVPSDGNYQWLNAKAYGLPHGLGLGGTLEGFRLFIPESLEGCIARNACTTFESGLLVPGENFELDALEVWSVGGVERIDRGMHAQKQHRDVARENIDKARKVDKAAFFNNAFDQEFLLSNTFAHKQYGDHPEGDIQHERRPSVDRRPSIERRPSTEGPK